jgi:hypothetical protein
MHDGESPRYWLAMLTRPYKYCLMNPAGKRFAQTLAEWMHYAGSV